MAGSLERGDSVVSGARQGAGFAISGAIAFATDAAVLATLTRGFGVDPFVARIGAIGVAMIAGYFAHRRLTFAVDSPPSLIEFAKFAGVASGGAALNYAIYAGVLLAAPQIEPLLALAIASIVAMAASYLGYRFGVFTRRD
jgi:putative flippase GtrA